MNGDMYMHSQSYHKIHHNAVVCRLLTLHPFLPDSLSRDTFGGNKHRGALRNPRVQVRFDVHIVFVVPHQSALFRCQEGHHFWVGFELRLDNVRVPELTVAFTVLGTIPTSSTDVFPTTRSAQCSPNRRRPFVVLFRMVAEPCT